MTEALKRLIPLLENDVVATLGEQYRHVARAANKYFEYYGDPAGYDEKVVENVQEEILETWIDTTWPACPRHGRHPLFYHDDGWWWCERDRVAVCKLGDLATLDRPQLT